MRRFAKCLILLATTVASPAGVSGAADSGTHPAIQAVATLQSPRLDEVSGLALSRRRADMLWAINDDGPPVVHAISTSGESLGDVHIDGAVNRDWEDLASTRIGGRDYLLVADFGDNQSKRDSVTIYVIEEPDPMQSTVELSWRIDFRFPGGSRDVESIAVDGSELLLLSKRDIPSGIYRLPLKSMAAGPHEAAAIGELVSLPQPSEDDIRRAPAALDWYWQPTAMAISRDGRQAAVLTYRAVYHYRRSGTECWLEALARTPDEYRLGDFDKAEALTFDASGERLWITTEMKHAPLLQLNLKGDATP